MESTHSSDADDEHCSQTSTSPGITLTPDIKSGPFKYPQSRSVTAKHNQPKSNPTQSQAPNTRAIKTEKDDDGFFSGFDIDECLTEEMDVC